MYRAIDWALRREFYLGKNTESSSPNIISNVMTMVNVQFDHCVKECKPVPIRFASAAGFSARDCFSNRAPPFRFACVMVHLLCSTYSCMLMCIHVATLEWC